MLGGKADDRRHLGCRGREGNRKGQPGVEVGRLIVPVRLAIQLVRQQAEIGQGRPDRGEERGADTFGGGRSRGGRCGHRRQSIGRSTGGRAGRTVPASGSTWPSRSSAPSPSAVPS